MYTHIYMQGGMRVYVTEHDTSPPGQLCDGYGFQMICFNVMTFLRVNLKNWLVVYFIYTENQVIKTDQMNILIRSLLLKQQQKSESSAKGAGKKEGSRKRYMFLLFVFDKIDAWLLILRFHCLSFFKIEILIWFLFWKTRSSTNVIDSFLCLVAYRFFAILILHLFQGFRKSCGG